MFSIKKFFEKDWHVIRLTDENTGTYVDIIPECGAILNDFRVYQGKDEMDVLLGFDNKEDFSKNVATKGFRSCKMSPFTGRIPGGEYTWHGKKYKIDKFMLAGAALHGLLYDLPFEVINELCDDHHATITLFFNYEGYFEGYPFHYEIRIVYTLKPGAQLTLSTDLVNRSDYPIPMMDGWHPYFHLGGSVNNLELKVATINKIELNDKLVPSGVTTAFNDFIDWSPISDKHFDDCYELDEPNHGYVLCSLRNPKNGWQIDIEPDHSYPYLQIYTPPDRRSISLENISAVPNAFCNGLGLKRLQPREHYRLNTTFTVHKK